KQALRLLTGLTTVILDEIHAVADTKRGTHLITAVDRLVRLSGEFQRIALSATVTPPEVVADFVGGYALEGTGNESLYRKRPVSVVQSKASKALAVEVRFPEEARTNLVDGSRWPALLGAAKEIIRKNRSTLLFANSRRLCERLSLLLNEDEEQLLAYAHHGSLAREMRAVVERRLKEGDLAAIVATNSLELGIDIGELDAVLLMQTPFSVSGTLQRIGRSGHRVGAVSRGILFPTHGRDFLDAAVMAKAVAGQEIEPIEPIRCPLDVLAQVLVSMTGMEAWDIDALYAFIRSSAPYHALARSQFDLVLEMLAGRYGEGRVRALNPLVRIDRLDNTVTGSGTGLRHIYLSGGTIPDRGYFALRREDTKAKVGELDEEFVWERKAGETFTLGTQRWRINAITHNDVLVTPGTPSPTEIPFWKGEELNRGRHLSERIGAFLEWADAHLNDSEFEEALQRDYYMQDTAAEELTRFLKRQRTATDTA
ncbi:MAG: ATP-dependent helicase, partial [bacterium]|nr:ATP-dependent helicase [bacterium]